MGRFCGIVLVFLPGAHPVTAAVTPTPSGIGWGHSWRPILSILEQLELLELVRQFENGFHCGGLPHHHPDGLLVGGGGTPGQGSGWMVSI